MRNFGLGEPRKLGCFALREFPLTHNTDDLRGQLRPQVFFVGIRQPQIPKHIAGSADKLEFVTLGSNLNISFNRLSRSRITSVSSFGVLIPFFDFFWNA